MDALPRSERARRILVVEDDADVRDLLAMCLVQLVPNAQAERAENGLVAQRLLLDEGPWDLVLCDIMMPGLDGARMLRDLYTRGALQGQRVLVLTAVPMEQIADLLQIPGICGYLQKPIDPIVLANVVEGLLGPARLTIPRG